MSIQIAIKYFLKKILSHCVWRINLAVNSNDFNTKFFKSLQILDKYDNISL